MATTQLLQLFSISTALLASGGIATLSLFDVPILQSQPASRALPLTRWLFSRGSHVFPTAALLSSASFFCLAYTALPRHARSLSSLWRHMWHGRMGLYVAAAALTLSIAPFTQLMRPTNFALIRLNEALGGSRSAASAAYREEEHSKPLMAGEWPRGADESVHGVEHVSPWWDWSPPQERTRRDSSKKQDEEVKGLLDRFAMLNGVRAMLMGLGGVVGLMGALAR
ncbi:hypothetical protein ACEQ8H_007004 [Pleosporales sp. CAS-2024a]